MTDDATRAVDLMADVSIWTADDWRRMLDAAATGATVDGLLRPPARRTWVGEALAAYDQSITAAGDQRGFPAPDFWVSRAQAAAAIAAAEQARIGNLIAWKQLRQSAPTSALPGGGDAIADEIEATLGIAPPTVAPVVPTFTPEEIAVILDGLGGISSGDAGSYPDETKALAGAIALRLGGSSPS